jgi:outer membrane protein assembly factor BamB
MFLSSARALVGLCVLLVPSLARAADAKALLKQSGVRGGLVVDLGCTDGRFAAALRANSGTIVHALVHGPVDAVREQVAALGAYGPVSVHRQRSGRLPYADGVVNLLVAEDLGAVPESEIRRVLAPLGVALLKDGETWRRISRSWPKEIDEWTHFMHGADNNAVAMDTAIGPPERMQWVAGPRWSKDHDVTPSIFAPVSAKGRLFYALEYGPVCVIDDRLPERYALVARDAFNGVLLWERPMAPWYSSTVIWGHIPVHSNRRLVAVDDRVYATLGLQAPVTALDAATGETVREYAGTDCTSEIVCDGKTLALVIRKENAKGGLIAGRDRQRFRRGFSGPEPGSEAVMAVDAASGKTLWRLERSCTPLTLGLHRGRAVFVEDKHVVCLDLATGKELWKTAFPARTVVLTDDLVLAATDRGNTNYAKSSKTITVAALKFSDGSKVWSAAGDCLPNFSFFYLPVDLYVARGQVWGLARKLEWNKAPGTGHLLGLDLQTGAVRTRQPLAGAFTPGHHVRCYKGKATENYLLFNKRGIEFVDIGEETRPLQEQWVRGACRSGILPCNGMIYAPPHSCACYPGAQIGGFQALASKADPEPKPAPSPQLETGPAYGLQFVPDTKPASPEDWPTYRHDEGRTGATATAVPANLTVAWQRKLAVKPSAPVVADGRLLVAGIDEHTVHCLDATTGEPRWRFVADGRVDSPPTVASGLVLFGSQDGYCYCLNAENGQLVWRFRGKAEERWVGSHGQVESAWPIHGSVLVQNQIAYFAAGRSSFLDGGITVYGLDIGSGMVRYRTEIVGPDPNSPAVVATSGRIPGALSDVLVGDADALYLRHVRLSYDLADEITPMLLSWGMKGEHHLMAGSGLLDDTLFNRTRWRYGNRIDRTQMLVADGDDVFGLRIYSGISWNCALHNQGDGYLIFRQNVGKAVPPVPRAERTKRVLNRIPYERYDWHTNIPIRVNAMVLTGAGGGDRRLFVAGLPDVVDPKDPLAAYEGRKGAEFLALSGETGEKLSQLHLPAIPVWDSLIASQGRLYIALQDGSLLCLAGKQ